MRRGGPPWQQDQRPAGKARRNEGHYVLRLLSRNLMFEDVRAESWNMAGQNRRAA
jgi:hypothetical protein